MNDEKLRSLADPEFEQYFLVSPEKLSLLLRAAEIQPNDRVLEVGAGAGTVARNLPPCKSLTLVELDDRLIEILRDAVPHAQVIQGDALHLVHELPFDVLIGNLPNTVTESLIDTLPSLSFRTAVLAVGQSTNLDHLRGKYAVTEVTTITGDDFRPSQPSVSRIVKVTRR
ncbi:rRNA adenine N-6-methyltransferase family protein [Amycolatopsis dongchuanensis]|uniref:Ribosomal RNA adenine methylase transferase N-terminal domain-containing protein n=1 Tax=Amycolatopsis dongchuanensis TaxID=1070866 RepID=A0ABP8VHP9_9PSEU